MNATTKARLLALHHSVAAFLVKDTKVWVAVLAFVAGVVVGAWVF